MVAPPTRLVFFTDLDGTLLDHHSYDWSPAIPALRELEQRGCPLVLNSSKTAEEIRALRRALENTHPYIVENGAATIVPAGYFGPEPEQVLPSGLSRDQVLDVLHRLRAKGFRFWGFEDMTVAELASVTGLDSDGARAAKARSGTEPLLWQGSSQELDQFRQALASEGISLQQGGRFLHAMGRFDKADGLRHLMACYRELAPDARWLSVALGDSLNDQAMLAGADLAVIIAGVNADRIKLPREHQVIRSSKPGPQGWNQCVMQILDRFG